jgi:hypothetical protein
MAGCPAVGEKEWKGQAMNHIPGTGKMVETPRTDAEDANWQRYYDNHRECDWPPICDVVSSDFARQLERELQEAQERIRLLIAERDSARQQADMSWKMREEFTALLGTDDVKEAVRGLKLMKAALECALPYCEYLHHKKAHQHASGAKCVPEELVRMAKRISVQTQTK